MPAPSEADENAARIRRAVVNAGSAGPGCPYVDLDRLLSPAVFDLSFVHALNGVDTKPFSCTVPDSGGSRTAKDVVLSFPAGGTFVGCLVLGPKQTLRMRIQADTFDAVTSLRYVRSLWP
jgi:hypothetical protein